MRTERSAREKANLVLARGATGFLAALAGILVVAAGSAIRDERRKTDRLLGLGDEDFVKATTPNHTVTNMYGGRI